MKKTTFTKLFALLAGIALIVPGLTLASEIRAGANENVDQTETINQNLYLAGPNPIIAGTVQGDLLVWGSNINMSGTVFQDAMLAGAAINITGHVGGDLRVAAGNIVIDGPVDGELMAAGGNVNIGPHAVIRGDVNIVGGQVNVDPSAQMLSSKINIQNGEKDRQTAPRPLLMDTNKFLTTAFWVGQLLMLLGIFVVVAIMHLLFPGFTKKFVLESSPKNFWKSFVLGLVLFIVMPIAAIISFVTIIGGFLGGLILIAYVAMIIVSVIYGGVVLGVLLYDFIKKPKRYAFGWWWLILGIVGLHVITWIPIVGWIIGFVFFLTAWGALLSLKWKQMKAM